MQRQIQNNAHQVQKLNRLNDMVKDESINYSADVKNVFSKIDKLETLYKINKMDLADAPT